MCRAPYTTHQEQLSRCCGKKESWEWQKKKLAPSIPVTISIDAKEKGSALNSVIITRRFGVCLERKTSRMVPRTKVEIFLGCRESEKREETQLSRAWHPFCYFRGFQSMKVVAINRDVAFFPVHPFSGLKSMRTLFFESKSYNVQRGV